MMDLLSAEGVAEANCQVYSPKQLKTKLQEKYDMLDQCNSTLQPTPNHRTRVSARPPANTPESYTHNRVLSKHAVMNDIDIWQLLGSYTLLEYRQDLSQYLYESEDHIR